MRFAIKLLIVCFALTGTVGCATTQKVDLNELLKPDPTLPRLEDVEVMGTLAVQRVVALLPDQSQIFQTADLFTVTSVLITILMRTPTEQLIADPVASEIAIFSLAHQWGRTQIILDYVNKYDQLLTCRYEEVKKERRSLAWSNFFLGLGSVCYGMSNTAATPAQRLSNELGITRNQQTIQINQKLSDLYNQRSQDIEDLRLQISQLRQQLVSYSNLLEVYKKWIFEVRREWLEQLSQDAVRILEAKATF